jgi:predicted ATPase with chaperone activity
MYFSEVINSLEFGQHVKQLSGWRRGLYMYVKQAAPDAFSKDGAKIKFVGNKNDLFKRESEIMNKVYEMGWVAPTVAPKQQKAEVIDETDLLTDEELFARIDDTFSSIALLAEAAANLKIRSMIVSGSPGTGKTFEVVKAVKDREAKSKNFYYHHLKGTISPVALYIELYRARHGVLILDDTDEAFTDNESLQLLKAATESSKERNIA